jgi:hypothetical protein
MTKEQFLNKWHYTGHSLISNDLNAVIAHEIEKAKGEDKPEAEQVTEPAKPKFDQDRFEAMFRAVVIASPHDTYERCMEITTGVIEKIDAFYASKKGGSND